RPGQRVAVALAGVGTELAFAGVLSLAVPALPEGPVADALLLYVIGCLSRCVLNLMPFVKLDGYMALMSHLDISHLRDKAMDEARDAMAARAFGSPRRRLLLPASRWPVLFGLGCVAFPVLMVGQAVILWTCVLPVPSAIAAVVVNVLLAVLVLRVGIGLYRLLARARAAGASRGRITASASALLLTAAGTVLLAAA
ncbi:daptide biosynthesis intramembrane metalloprotease, partial [Streptomyces sp. URMC 123]